ncbi:carotenoid oxygenase family protein [Kamptonema formosum]|uniref:carotenoid oxygenase family protein n=1 Tax=Kamptonema formosum TaxID=331992 RepID=UPI00034A3ACA|nr:carotenoid oxygenase family protein [Oscillatoria sp. PCC 10802]
MTVTTPPASPPAWAKAILPPAAEFGPTPLPVTAGAIPTGLRGTLYRNGPARLERGGRRVGHWFDGDGAILATVFAATATGTYRYVRTAGYLEEQAKGQMLYGGYGTLSPAPFWQRLAKQVKNAANTSVLALPDRLLALWEGGHPHALDPHTLETLGLDSLGWLAPNWFYSAHPKQDPQTGEIYNFGVTPGKTSQLRVSRCNSQLQLLQQTAIPLNGVPLIHDFALAGPYLIFFISPVRLQVIPALLQLKSLSDALRWCPEKGTQILVLDRTTLSVVSKSEAEPWYQWHFANGYAGEGGAVVVDIVRYDDFQTNQRLKEVAAGQTQTPAQGSLWRVRLEPLSGKIAEMRQLLARSCEFPAVPASEVGRENRFTYLSLHRQGTDVLTELYDSIGRFDSQTGTLTEANLGAGRYPAEPIYAPDADSPQQGWILTVVFDSEQNRSEVWVFDALGLDGEPVCRLALPEVVPPGFHGTWVPAG